MSFSFLDSIQKKTLAVLVLAIVVAGGLFLLSIQAMKVFDNLVLLARGERDHTVNFDRASIAFERYVRTGDDRDYQAFKDKMNIALGITSVFSTMADKIGVYPQEELARLFDEAVPTFDHDQSVAFTRLYSLIADNAIVRRLMENAANGAKWQEEYLELAERYRQASTDEERVALLARITQLSSLVQDETQKFSQGISELSGWGMRLITTTLFVIFVVLFVVAGWVTSRLVQSITKPVIEATRFAGRVASGDLTGRLQVSSRDETGNLIRAMNTISETMGEIIGSLADRASSLSAAGEELSAVSTQIASGAEEVLRETMSVSSSSDQVSRNSQAVATSVEEMNQGIAEVARRAADATRIASEAADLALRTDIAFQRLGSSSSEIGDVIDVISSIAGQTNLLALNATIEAARAGDAGRGFAIVAGEVKTLARQTSEATLEIQSRIEAIQADVRESAAAVETITAIVSNIDEIQGAISAAVEQQSTICSQILTSIQKTANDGAAIAENVAAVAESTRVTSQGTHAAMESANSLAHIASELQQLVQQFRVAKSPT
jgi:methyl-accepting chemotaxis protein